MEYPIWENKDKHRNAYLVLKEERAQRMGKLLDKDVLRPETGCVSCHGINAPEKLRHSSFSLEEGVSCAACHGAYRDWVDEHGSFLKRDEWRAHSRTVKEERFGMTDLWNGAKRTSVCVSCHIGNVQEGKFVSHDMYAAGHPPLPGIEVATFGNQMPRHWQFMSEKNPKVQEALGVDPHNKSLEQTKLMVISSMASLSETMKLLAAQADKCAAAKETDARALDLANFDCYACHHDLKSPSPRQERGYVGKPGRPQMASWPTRLARVSLEEILKNEQAGKVLDAGMKSLYQAFSVQPFGNCREISTAATVLAAQLDQFAAELDKPEVKYDRDTAWRLLRKLCSQDEKDIPDYDTARQIAWAIDLIYSELIPEAKERDPKIVEVLDALKRELKLVLPVKAAKPEKAEKQIIIEALPDSLVKRNEYDPKAFKSGLKTLLAILSAKQ
jgi:hypothetical protein